MKVETAMQQQAMAQGQPGVAAAMQLVQLIRVAIDLQQASNVVAGVVQGGSGSELNAAIKQEEVTEKIQAALDRALTRPQIDQSKTTDRLAQSLVAAKQASIQAAMQTLNGNSSTTSTSRQQVTAELKNALNLAAHEAALHQPSNGQLDLPAQSQAAKLTSAAREDARQVSMDAHAAIESAALATAAAERALSGKDENISVAQKQAMDALHVADDALKLAIQQVAREQARVLAIQSKGD